MAKNEWIVPAIIIVVALYLFGGFGGKEPVTPTVACGNGICETGENNINCPADCKTEIICDSTTTPSLDFLCRDIENKGTSIICTAHYIVTNGDGLIQTDADATNVALNAKDNIEYYINSTGWYGVHGTYTVPCEEEPRLTILMKDYATTPTQQLFAEDDGLLMSEGTNTEAVAAADQPSLKYIYYANTEDYVQDALLFCQFDKTYYDDVLYDDDAGDSSLIPRHFSVTAAGGDEAGHDGSAGAWSLGDIKGTKQNIHTLTFDTDDTNDATNYNVSCKLDDQDWFINEDKGIFEYGSADENDADIAQTTAWSMNVTFYSG